MSTKPHFSGFYDDLHQYLQSVSVSDEYLLNSTHTDVNWSQFNVKNDRKCAKSSNFVVQMATIPLFIGFYDGLHKYLQYVSVSDKYPFR